MPEGMRNLGSSWQSLLCRQGSIETDYLNGEIVSLGRKHGIPTPFNAVLQRVASEMAAVRELPGKYSAEELFAMAERLATRRPSCEDLRRGPTMITREQAIAYPLQEQPDA